MKKNKLTFGALLVSMAAAVTMSTASAQLSSAQGDLFLGFTSNATTTSYLVKLGKGTDFLSGNISGALSISGIKADLDTIFGTNWSSNPYVYWGVFGANSGISTVNGQDRGGTNYASLPQTAFGTPREATGTAYFSRQNTVQASTGGGSKITSMRGVYNTSTATENNAVGIAQDNTATNSFASFQNASYTLSFGSFDNAMGNFGNGAASTALDLFRIEPTGNSITTGSNIALGTPGVRLGTFTIDGSTGTLSFAPVPEPSVYGAAIVCALAALVIARRRRKATV